MNISILELKKRPAKGIEQLTSVWELSVRATHDFLSEDQINEIKPWVKLGLLSIPILYATKDTQGTLCGFMGIEHNKIEMLFINPKHRGLGIGRMLVTKAIRTLGVTLVDVNEQNPQAIGFYKHMGFTILKRSPRDAQGNPFPILHMGLKY